jgi:hypothetical protein
MSKSILTILCILSGYMACVAQKIENVDLDIKNNIIVVKYDLINEGENNYAYDIRLRFRDEKDDFTTPRNPSGDLKNVRPGTGKEITWNVLADNQEIKGNISAVVEIEGKHRYRSGERVVGGPSNAFLSMLLPGLGDYFVNKYADEKMSPDPLRKSLYIVPLAYYLCMYGAISQYTQYKKSYDEYHNATNQLLMDEHYKQANQKFQTSQALLGVAASAWLCDVIYVAARGFKNRKHQMNGYSFKERKTSYYIVTTGSNLQFGLTHKF